VVEPSRTEWILDRAHNAVISINQRGLVTYWNPSAETLFGIGQREALGRSVAELIIPQELREAHTAGLQRFLAEGAGPMLDRRVELTALRYDGGEFPVELTISAFDDGDEWKFTAFVQDITERKENERQRERLVQELRRALHGSERILDAIVGSMSDPVTIRSRDDRLLYANRAALVHLGMESVTELRRTPPREIMAGYDVFAADGSEVSMSDIPSVRLLKGEPAEPLLIRAVDHRTGVERWSLLKAAPVLDEAGEVEATIMFTEDVTEQKRAELRAEFLSRASEVLGSSLDYEQTLRNVAQLAVPDVADWCAVDLLDADGDRVSVAIAHADPSRLELAEELRTYEPEQLDPEQGLGRVLRTGEPVIYADIADEMLVEGAVDERHLELLRAVGFRSAALVPLRIGERTLGALTLVNAESRREIDRADIDLAEQIAARAAVAIENARVYSERSTIAHTLQQSLLPEELPEVPGYELAAVYMPAVEGTEVGGDFYDVWEAGGSWMVVIGDVTGKGVEAAALTSLVRHTLRATSEFVSSPAELLSRLDLILKKQRRRSMCTALCLRLEPDRVTLAIGGHPLPFHMDESGTRQIGEYGLLLGAFEDVGWQDIVLELAPESTLVIYTDGVTDAVGDAGERYGPKRLQAALDRCRELSASGVIESLAAALGQFQVGEHADDTAVLALRRIPQAARGTWTQEAREIEEVQALTASS
jgi:PAS domain S-box-containing protein